MLPRRYSRADEEGKTGGATVTGPLTISPRRAACGAPRQHPGLAGTIPAV